MSTVYSHSRQGNSNDTSTEMAVTRPSGALPKDGDQSTSASWSASRRSPVARRRVAVLRRDGRLSQKTTHFLETRTRGSGFFRAPNQSAINFPLQVQWIDGGHWISHG